MGIFSRGHTKWWRCTHVAVWVSETLHVKRILNWGLLLFFEWIDIDGKTT